MTRGCVRPLARDTSDSVGVGWYISFGGRSALGLAASVQHGGGGAVFETTGRLRARTGAGAAERGLSCIRAPVVAMCCHRAGACMAPACVQGCLRWPHVKTRASPLRAGELGAGNGVSREWVFPSAGGSPLGSILEALPARWLLTPGEVSKVRGVCSVAAVVRGALPFRSASLRRGWGVSDGCVPLGGCASRAVHAGFGGRGLKSLVGPPPSPCLHLFLVSSRPFSPGVMPLDPRCVGDAGWYISFGGRSALGLAASVQHGGGGAVFETTGRLRARTGAGAAERGLSCIRAPVVAMCCHRAGACMAPACVQGCLRWPHVKTRASPLRAGELGAGNY